jgi:glycosyltransferase involved in cell wall biosynthesis
LQDYERASLHLSPLNIFVLHPSDLLTDCLPHGDGLLANLYVRKLAARGHKLHIAATNVQITEAFPDNVTIHKIEVPEPCVSSASRIRYAFKVRALYRRLSSHTQFNLIHQLNPVVTGLSLSMIGINKPIVMGPYVPDWPLVRRGNKLQKPTTLQSLARIVKRGFWYQQHRMASKIILSSVAAMQKVPNHRQFEDKVHIIPYGIDIANFQPAELPVEKTILFLAKISHHKGIMILLDAFRKVHEELRDAKLLVAGHGPEMGLAQAAAATIGDGRAVQFLGKVERNNVPATMQNCTVFCLPSFGEAFGMSVLEAMACGRAVVATDAGGLRHIVTDNGGRKVPVGDPDKLAKALIEVLKDPTLARNLGSFNRRQVEKNYAWENVIDRIEALYYDVLSESFVGQSTVYGSCAN